MGEQMKLSFWLIFFHGKVGSVAGGSEQMKLHGQVWCDPELAGFGCLVAVFSIFCLFSLVWFGVSW